MLEILQQRFARGEVNPATYQQMRAQLEAPVAWIKSYHRLRYRYERKKRMFSGFMGERLLGGKS